MESKNEIEINREIMDYKESIILGFDLRECFFSMIAAVLAVIIFLNLRPVLGTEITSWICIICAIPFAGFAFIKFQRMNAEQIIVTVWRSIMLSHTKLIDQPENLFYEWMKPYLIKHRKDVIKENDKNFRNKKKTKQTEI